MFEGGASSVILMTAVRPITHVDTYLLGAMLALKKSALNGVTAADGLGLGLV